MHLPAKKKKKSKIVVIPIGGENMGTVGGSEDYITLLATNQEIDSFGFLFIRLHSGFTFINSSTTLS